VLIDVQIGTDQQRQQIRAELEPLRNLLDGPDRSCGIEAVIVPQDFDECVNRLQGTTTYRSIKDTGASGVLAVAKVLKKQGATTIVLSPYLYSADNDNQTRGFIILHEVMHVFNNMKLDVPKQLVSSRERNLGALYSLYDEYLSRLRCV
jgi:hypothetical protein